MAPGLSTAEEDSIYPHTGTSDVSAGEPHDFTPKGAIAFFVLMILMFTVMWFSIYFELIKRI